MSRLTESAIETFAIKLFEGLGYDTLYAPDIASDSEHPERSRYDEAVLSERLRKAVQRINPTVSHHALQEAVKEVERIHSPELLANNETFHRLLTESVKVSNQKKGQDSGDLVWLIDFAYPENASIDWTIKKSVRAKLKVILKRTLRQFGYPPDMQLLATETVLKQAEMIANELASL